MVEGTTATDLVLKVVEMLRKRVASSVNLSSSSALALTACRWPTAPLSPTWRPNTAPPAVSSPSTTKPCAICATPGATRQGSFWSRPTLAKTAMWRGADYAPVYTDTLQLDMGTIVPAISGPKRPQDFVSHSATPNPPSPARWPHRTFQRPMGKHRSPSNGEDYTTGIGKGGDRLDHLVHQHLEPLRDDRRGACGPQGAQPSA